MRCDDSGCLVSRQRPKESNRHYSQQWKEKRVSRNRSPWFSLGYLLAVALIVLLIILLVLWLV